METNRQKKKIIFQTQQKLNKSLKTFSIKDRKAQNQTKIYSSFLFLMNKINLYNTFTYFFFQIFCYELVAFIYSTKSEYSQDVPECILHYTTKRK